MPIEDKFMTVEEVAEYLGFSKQTIYDKVHDNRIPFHKIGPKAVRFKKVEIDAWIEKQKNEEKRYLKKGERYYLVSESPIGSCQISREDVLLDQIRSQTRDYWRTERLPFEFNKEVLEAAKDILDEELVYPRLIKKNTPVYEYPDINIIAVDLDLKENSETLRSYKQKYSGIENVIFAPGNEEILRTYSIRLTTTKYAIGRDGKILYAGSGAFKTEQWKVLLDALKNS